MKSSAKMAFGFASVFCACTGSSTPTAGTETWTVHISGSSISSGSGSLTFSSNGTWKGSWVVEYTGSPPGTVTCPINSGTFVSTADGSLSAEGYGTAANPNTPVPNSPFVLRIDGHVADDGTASGTWTITFDNWPIVLSGTWVALLANGSGVLVGRPSGPGTGGAGGVRPVLAGNGGGLLGGSPGLDAGPSPPLAPSNLTAITSWTEIDLSWLDNANNETGFKIESSRGSTAGYTELASLQPDATAYSDKGLLPATTYYYRIYAYNDSGNSKYLQANFTTKSCSTNRDCPAQLNCYQSMCQSPELTPPQAPSNFKTTSLWTEVDFTWTDNANNEESFKVERSTGDAGYVLVASLPPDTTAYSDTGLLPGTGYHYRIYAHNAVGDSPSYGALTFTQSCGRNTDCPAGNTCNSAGACVGATTVSPGDGGLPDGSPSLPEVAISRPEVLQVPLLRVSPPALNFGDVDVGQASPALTVTVTNTGALTALTPTVDVAAFAITSTTCSIPAASCTISIVFTPASATVASGTLIVAPGLTVSLTGTGSPPRAFTATLSAIPGTVLANQPVPFTVTVTATGAIPGLACISSSANVTADPTKTTCLATVPANAPCAFGFTFKAATAGPKTETIVCSGGTTVRNVTVTTTVVTPPILTITPTPASFSADVGATSQVTIFSVGNAGGTASGVLTKVIGGANATEFVITNDGCVLPLAALATCTIQVVFKPTTPGARAATITVSDPTGGSTPASATMSGVATPGTVRVVISGTQNLGSVQFGQAGTASVFTVTNRGVAATGALTLATDDPEFAIDSDACSGLSLAASANCMFTITFTPTTAAAKSAVVTAKSGATVLGTLMISGTGVAAPRPAAL